MTPPLGPQKPEGPQELVPSQLVLPVQAEDQPQGHQKPFETTATPLPSAGITLSHAPDLIGYLYCRELPMHDKQPNVQQRPVLTDTGASSPKKH